MKYTAVETHTEERLNFWQSYSDMMAALLLVFMLVLVGTLHEMRVTYEKKESELIEKQQIIDQQQGRIDAIIGVRSELIEALRNEFADSDFSITIDPQTGAILFDSNLLFEVDKHSLREAGKDFLNVFLPKYFAILLSDNFLQYVSEIIIEGHTDTNGGYMYNLQLSQNRALAVATYCLGEESLFSDKELEILRGIITANGRSWSAPIYNVDGTVDMDSSRRVEIKFRLKDEEMIEEFARILEGF